MHFKCSVLKNRFKYSYLVLFFYSSLLIDRFYYMYNNICMTYVYIFGDIIWSWAAKINCPTLNRNNQH